METFGNVDSKFRFIILASKRAKQILKGAKPKIELKSRNPVRIAQAEIMESLIEYEIIPLKAEETREQEERVLGEEGIPEDAGEGDVEAEADDGDRIVAGAADDDEDEDHSGEEEVEDPAAESEESDEDD